MITKNISADTQRLYADEQARREKLTKKDLADFVPHDETTLVSYAKEYAAPAGLTVVNWKHAGLDHYGSIDGGKKIGGDPTKAPGIPKLYEKRRFVRGVLLHGTTNYNWVGAGVDPKSGYGLSVHFSVGPSGTVYQHNDIGQQLEHAGSDDPPKFGTANQTCVGIEVIGLSVFNVGEHPVKPPKTRVSCTACRPAQV